MPRGCFRAYLSTLLDLIFPRRCLGCGRSGHYLCSSCLAVLPPAETSEPAGAEALFDYGDPRVKRAVWLLKYRGGRQIARDLARPLYERWLEREAERRTLHPERTDKWLVVPVPAARSRERQRGFNQARELARELAALDPTNLELDDKTLIKIKNTASQVTIKNRATRLNNLRGAFAVSAENKARLAGRRVLIIDDVITTGATVSEARRALGTAGAKEIFALAVAHG